MKFFKTPIGTIVLVVLVMIPVIIGMAYVLRKKDKIQVEMNPFANEPLETVYSAPLSDIKANKEKFKEIEDSNETEKKDLKPESKEKPKANVPSQKPDKPRH